MHTRYGFKGTFEQYMDLFMKGELGCGSYWDHLKACKYYMVNNKKNAIVLNLSFLNFFTIEWMAQAEPPQHDVSVV